MTQLDKLQLIIDKYQHEAEIIPIKGYYSVCSLPETLNDQIRDFINTHFDVISGDVFGVEFKTK